MLWLLAQILFAWLQSFSLSVVAVCVVAACAASVGVRIVRTAPIRATVVRRILLLAPFFAAAFSSQAPGDLRYYFTLFQGGENIGKHFVFALSAVHYDEAFFVFPRLL